MRALFLSQEFPPETAWGGIGTYAGIIGPALVRAGVDVHVLSIVAGQPQSERTVDGVHVLRRPLRRPPGIGRLTRLPLSWARLSLARAVAREYRRLTCDFDVCESPEWYAEGLALAWGHTLPMVVRSHSAAGQILPYLGRIGIDQRLAIRCENELLRRADVVTGPAAQLSSIGAALHLDPERLRPINYPILPVSRRQPPKSATRVIYLGRFEARKNPDVLLRAVPAVLRAVPQARFRLRGRDTGTPDGGSYVVRLRRMAESLGVAHAVEIVDDWASPEEAQGELADAAVCVFPSRWESFGNVAAEAAAQGRPVIASDIPAVHEIVEDGVTGRLVAAEDVDSWSAALIELLSDASMAQAMGEAAARRMVERCHPDRVAALTVDAYELAITSHRSAAASR